MIEKKFVELQNDVILEIHTEAGRWKYLVAGGEEFGEWDATLIPPEGAEGWTVRGRTPDPQTREYTVYEMAQGRGLDYEAATALAMGFMAEPSGNFEYFDGKPYSFVSNPDTGVLVAEALPQSNTRRTLSVAPDQDGFWKAICDTSYWDEEHRYFLMHGLTFDLGPEQERDEALRRGLHWLVNASII
ncbi:hypothetical protein ELH67_08550 [Rhizobium ruizarguesonis]|uniref:hypothetical protein n=1 Tax=Rhizobium ruizarguesonis TaxID=2081791 RepID=UPI001030377A|nr:hypothetical protein [Rhizobium ruizarguesonis]TAZ94597.1 hypothetical protein ELH67_08550 [Rhizobium ruizarguesonis]